MRIAAAVLTFLCLAACSMLPTQPDQASAEQDGWRQQQAALDAQVILQGMAQARQRAQELARSAR